MVLQDGEYLVGTAGQCVDGTAGLRVLLVLQNREYLVGTAGWSVC